jgi:hypothetical protein
MSSSSERKFSNGSIGFFWNRSLASIASGFSGAILELMAVFAAVEASSGFD